MNTVTTCLEELLKTVGSLSCSKRNKIFKHHKHDFFVILNSLDKCDVDPPPLAGTLKFWKDLWASPCLHSAAIFPYVIEATGPVDSMTTPVISAEVFTYAVSRIKNWKAPGPDYVLA